MTVVDIRIHDVLLMLICLLFFFNRDVFIDYSSLWQLAILCVVYVGSNLIKKKFRYFLLFAIFLWGIVEIIIAILQKFYLLESNNHNFVITGTFGNPSPLSGLLALCLPISILYIYKNLGKRIKKMILVYFLITVCVLYGLVISESRAGWVAAFAGSLFLVFGWLKHIRSIKVNLVLLKSMFLFIIIIFVVFLYFLKKDSADGRLLIWSNTINMIADYPILGVGTGGWLANYMYYQADYFLQNPDSTYIILADNVFYPYNEFLHIAVDQGTIGLLIMITLFYNLFNYKNEEYTDYLLKAMLAVFLVFSFFSYSANIFPLQILFAALIGMMRSYTIKRVFISSSKVHIIGGLLFLSIVCISTWSYHIYYKISALVEKEQKSECDSLYLDNLYPFFCYNPVLMDLYSQTCLGNYSLDKELEILQTTTKIAPTCELYYNMGDLWKQEKDFVQAEKCYQMAAAMIPHRLSPQYKLFRLYVEQGDKKSAFRTGNILLRQPVKKEGTKTLRMKAEVLKYFEDEQW